MKNGESIHSAEGKLVFLLFKGVIEELFSRKQENNRPGRKSGGYDHRRRPCRAFDQKYRTDDRRDRASQMWIKIKNFLGI